MLCSTLCAYSQEDNPYIFKGIPIEGSAENFIQKLVKQGYKTEDIPAMSGFYKTALSGLFFNNDVAILLLVDKSNNVTGVGIMFHFMDSYVSTDKRIETYKSIRNGLQIKYENSEWITHNTNDFKDMNLNDVRYELTIHGKEYKYCVTDSHSNLYIRLSISKDAVMLTYQNPNAMVEAREQLVNDL